MVFSGCADIYLQWAGVGFMGAVVGYCQVNNRFAYLRMQTPTEKLVCCKWDEDTSRGL